MAALCSYPWPGNVRELQNHIERAVIWANDGVLPNLVPASGLQPTAGPAAPAATSESEPSAPTLKDYKREPILQALNACGGVIGGVHGAAAKLGVKRTNLIHKMKKHGIYRPRRQAGGSAPSGSSQVSTRLASR